MDTEALLDQLHARALRAAQKLNRTRSRRLCDGDLECLAADAKALAYLAAYALLAPEAFHTRQLLRQVAAARWAMQAAERLDGMVMRELRTLTHAAENALALRDVELRDAERFCEELHRHIGRVFRARREEARLPNLPLFAATTT